MGPWVQKWNCYTYTSECNSPVERIDDVTRKRLRSSYGGKFENKRFQIQSKAATYAIYMYSLVAYEISFLKFKVFLWVINWSIHMSIDAARLPD